MEDLFALLGNPGRMWVVRYLITHGSAQQAELAREFAKTGLSTSSVVNDGGHENLPVGGH
jgi:hypothetical protein